MKLLFSSLVLFTLSSSLNAHVEISDDNSAIDAGLKQWRLMIPGPEVTLDGSLLGLKDQVVISDVGTMKRTGQTNSFMHLNDVTFKGSLGFTDLKITGVSMEDGDTGVELGGTKLDKATITSPDNSIDIEYSAKIQKVGCMIEWKKFSITKMSAVKVNGGEDVTDEFNEKVLPSLNKHLNDKPFLDLLNEELTPCKESPLRKLFWGS